MKHASDNKAVRRLGFATLGVTALFIVLMLMITLFSAGKLEIELPEQLVAAEYVPETPGIVTVVPDETDSRHLILHAEHSGKVFLFNEDDSDFLCFRVLPGGIIFDYHTGNISGGYQQTVLVVCYLLILTILIAASFFVRCRSQLYSYNTLYFGGLMLFMLGVSTLMIFAAAELFRSDPGRGLADVCDRIANAGSVYMLYSLPVLLVCSIALIASNIILWKREGRSFANTLGFLVSGLILVGYLVYFLLLSRLWSGSELELRIMDALFSVFTTCFAYCGAFFLGTVICGLAAAMRKPKFDKTHVIILGCAIAEDGTPLPLLRDRIECAIRFANAQKEQTGRDIVFVPSGGQGSDEVISEGECMRNYLLSKGIPDSRILAETKSVNTRENMAFSQKLIKADCDDPAIIFSTSNYHVLRSGIISENAGLDAEGIGCKTKWYFWPNAFIREFIGLIVSKWRRHVFWLMLFIVFFGLMNLLMPLM